MLRAARPHARFYGIQKSSSLRCLDHLIGTIETLLSVPRESLFIDLRKHENRARVHFIPDLKVGVFVTLRAPDV